MKQSIRKRKPIVCHMKRHKIFAIRKINCVLHTFFVIISWTHCRSSIYRMWCTFHETIATFQASLRRDWRTLSPDAVRNCHREIGPVVSHALLSRRDGSLCKFHHNLTPTFSQAFPLWCSGENTVSRYTPRACNYISV